MATELVSKESLQKAVVALRECCKKIDNKRLFNSDKLSVQLAVKKIINEPQKLNKILLPHTPIDVKSTDICLFVKDVDKKSRDYETTIAAYKDLFKEQEIHTKIDIFPMKKLKIEFNDYQAKRRLANLYDLFLCDSRVIRLMPSILGKHFYGKKKFPRQVRLARVDIKNEIEKCLKTSVYDVKNRGACCQALFGGLHNSDLELVDNLHVMVSALVRSTPGGWKNVRLICIKSEQSVAVPIYVSYGDRSEVELDDKVKLPGKSDDLNIDSLENPSDLLLEQAEEVSTVTRGLVVVTDDGQVLVVGDDGDVINCDRDVMGDNDDDVRDRDDGDDDDDDDEEDDVVREDAEIGKRIMKMKRRTNSGDDDDDDDVGDDDDDDVDDDDDDADMGDKKMGKVGRKRKRTSSSSSNNKERKNKDNKKFKFGTEDSKNIDKRNNNSDKNNKSQQPKSVKSKNSNNKNKNNNNNNDKGGEGSRVQRSKKVKRVVVGKGRDDLKFSGRRV